MIRVNVYVRYQIKKALKAVDGLPDIIGNVLTNLSGNEVAPEEISIRIFTITGRGCMKAETEIEMIMNKNESLVKNKDTICAQVAEKVNNSFDMKECNVWLDLYESGCFVSN